MDRDTLKAGGSQSVTRRIGDQLYVRLWCEDETEIWAAFCAACGLEPLVFWKSGTRRQFDPSRRCHAHKNASAKVGKVVRVADDDTVVAVFLHAKTELDASTAGLREKVERLPAVAAKLLRERIEAGAVQPPQPVRGSGWFRKVEGGFFFGCDTCGHLAVMLTDPRTADGWPMVRCRPCRKVNRRVPSPFASWLTAKLKDRVFRAALDAVKEEGETRQAEAETRTSAALMRYARIAQKVLHASFREEHGS